VFLENLDRFGQEIQILNMNQNSSLKCRRLVLSIFLAIVICSCSPKETVIEDCRKSETCPVTFSTSLIYAEDENGSKIPSDYIKSGTKFLILADKEGKIQQTKGTYGSSMMKVLYNEKEIYIHKFFTSYDTILRNLDKKGTILFTMPDKKSPFAGNLPYNSSARIISQNGPIESPNTFLKVTSGNLIGWAEKRSFTDGNYDAGLHKKSINELVENFSVNAVSEGEEITIQWTGTDYLNSKCSLKGEECALNHTFGDASYGSKDEALILQLTKLGETSTRYTCEIRRIDFIDAYASIENKKLSPYMNCSLIPESEEENSYD
jgi:hypothetical protein